MSACPICRTETSAKYRDTPYFQCPTCDVLFQDPMPPKVYAGAHEPDPEAMSESERQVNRDLAKWLFEHVMGGKAGPTLDVGAKFPVLASELWHLSCTAVAMDGDPRVEAYAKALGVTGIVGDFEQLNPDEDLRHALPSARYSLITFIHVFEHTYDPLAVLRKLRRMIADDGAVFIRLPDHRVTGIERDLTPGHLTIHPYIYTLTAMLQALAETQTFAITESYPLVPGQRDLILRPL